MNKKAATDWTQKITGPCKTQKANLTVQIIHTAAAMNVFSAVQHFNDGNNILPFII